MKKSARNYLTIVGGLLLTYFMFTGILAVSEDRRIALAAAPGSNPPTEGWLIAAIALCGLGAFFCFGYAIVSKWNRLKPRSVFHSMRSVLMLVLSSLTGGIVSLLVTVAMIGVLPSLKFTIPDFTSKTPVAAVPPQASSQASSQAPASSEKPSEASSEESKADQENPVEKANGVMTVEDAQTITSRVSTDQSDQSVILGKDLSSITLSQSIVEKTGDTTDLKKTLEYGINAAVLAGPGSTLNALGSSISSFAIGAPAVVISGENASANITDTDVASSGGSSPVFMSLQSGQIHINGGWQHSLQDTSPVFYVDSHSSLSADACLGQSDGPNSPVIYNAGTFTASQLNALSGQSATAVVGPGSSTALTSSTITTAAIDQASGMEGVFIIRDPKNTANVGDTSAKNREKKKASGKAEISLTGCTINFSDLATRPGTAVFYPSYVDSNITLSSNSELAGFNTLMRLESSSSSISAKAQILYGEVVGDDQSEIEMTLTEGTGYGGAINTDQSMKKAVLHIDESSRFSLSQDTYLTELDNKDTANSNITTNGYHLYVNGQQVL